MGSGPGRPVKTHGPPHGPGGAAHIEPTYNGPRPGPAHQIFKRLGPARHNFQIGPARPGPDKQALLFFNERLVCWYILDKYEVYAYTLLRASVVFYLH